FRKSGRSTYGTRRRLGPEAWTGCRSNPVHERRSGPSGGPPLQWPQHRGRRGIEREDIPPDCGAEWLCEFELVQVTVTERNVAFSRGADPLLGRGKRSRRLIEANDFALVANELRGQQRGVAPSAADVQHPHAPPQPGLLEKVSGYRIDQLRLKPKSLQLALRMS